MIYVLIKYLIELANLSPYFIIFGGNSSLPVDFIMLISISLFMTISVKVNPSTL